MDIMTKKYETLAMFIEHGQIDYAKEQFQKINTCRLTDIVQYCCVRAESVDCGQDKKKWRTLRSMALDRIEELLNAKTATICEM